MRERQFALLQRLEAAAAVQPQPDDLVGVWFDDRTAAKLTAAGIISLGELNARIAAGGRWYRTLPAVGKAKAQRIAQHLAILLPAAAPPVRPRFALAAIDLTPPASTLARTPSPGSVETGPPRLLAVASDAEAVTA